MAKGNTHFKELKREYIFPVIEKKLADLKSSHPEAKVLNLGVGDVALPLAPSISQAIQKATQEMSCPDSVYGYGPSEGYSFLRSAIYSNMYPFFSPEEIFISDGINTDIANILDLFHNSCSVAIPNPAYPAYFDINLIAGRKNRVIWMPCTLETDFIPEPPSQQVDLIYLCSPHNPTGVAMNKKQLTRIVDYAKTHDAIILHDSAYEAFITSPDIPRTIYEIPGAEDVSIEFRSFSKSAGFTGLRCSYLVLPKTVFASFGKKRISLHSLWKKRQSIKSNGVSYPIQRGAEACFFPKEKAEISLQISHYLRQAHTLKNSLQKSGYTSFGGVDAPYIWWKTPNKLSSWEFCDLLLNRLHLIAIPGVGFGHYGEGYVRLSSFVSEETAQRAAEKIKQL